jgi:hypothetical protein
LLKQQGCHRASGPEIGGLFISYGALDHFDLALLGLSRNIP